MKFTLIKKMVEDSDTKIGRSFDLAVQFLVVFSLVTFSLETLPNLSQDTRMWLRYAEIGTVFTFTIEYLLRILVSDKKMSFIFSFWGLIDLLAILPFYVTSGLDLRGLRAFRLFRLVRIFKLLRYGKAMRRFQRAFLIAKEEMVIFFCTTIILLFLAAVGIYYFENEAQPSQFASVFHGLWWAVATLTTVGYGDVYPVTVGGKIFTFLVLMIGLGIVAVPAGLVASALAKARKEEDDLANN